MSTTNPTSPTRAQTGQNDMADLLRSISQSLQANRDETMAMVNSLANCMQLMMAQTKAKEDKSELRQVVDDKVKNGELAKIWCYTPNHIMEGITLEAFMIRLRTLHDECVSTQSVVSVNRFLEELKRLNPHVRSYCNANARQSYTFEEVESLIRVKSELPADQLELIIAKWSPQTALKTLIDGAGHKFEFLAGQLTNLFAIARKQPLTPDVFWLKIESLLSPADRKTVECTVGTFKVGNRMTDFVQYLEANFSATTANAAPRQQQPPSTTPRTINPPDAYPMDIGLVADKVYDLAEMTTAQMIAAVKSMQDYTDLVAKGDTVAAVKMQTDKKIFCFNCRKLTNHMAAECKSKKQGPKGQAQH